MSSPREDEIIGGPLDGATWAGHNVTPEEARRMADEAFELMQRPDVAAWLAEHANTEPPEAP